LSWAERPEKFSMTVGATEEAGEQLLPEVALLQLETPGAEGKGGRFLAWAGKPLPLASRFRYNPQAVGQLFTSTSFARGVGIGSVGLCCEVPAG